MVIEIKTTEGKYPVYLERGALNRAAELCRAVGPAGRFFIVSDTGVPDCWKERLSEQFPDAPWFEIEQGEASKDLETYKALIGGMLKVQISRKDCLIALGGGVVGDIAGFAAATYMRGIRFVNIPTTALAQVDSCIGGKTALDLNGIKNCIGAFWQPSAVIIDPDVLSTLPQRQLSNGLAEAVKAGIIRDPELFEIFEKTDAAQFESAKEDAAQFESTKEDAAPDILEEIIFRALMVKKTIVEEDEKENGARKLLNFGHTLGHAYESYYAAEKYLHGECVAMGMLPMTGNAQLRARIAKVLEKLGLPTKCDADPQEILRLIANDKKADHGKITVVAADEPGKACLKNIDIQELKGMICS